MQSNYFWHDRWRHEWHGIDMCCDVKILKRATKIVLIQLADFHNKTTGQCNSRELF